VPSWGDVSARLLIVGLAPAAHGGNRTGRLFTGDRSGDWLFRALHRFGFASQPSADSCHDGLSLIDCYITAVLHCAPPQNKLELQEILNCRPYLAREVQLLKSVRVIVALGKLAYDQVWFLQKPSSVLPKPVFRHGLEVVLKPETRLLASFHPSQQNTFTGKLTEAMFDAIFDRARQMI
jgi:uracil-DNA glycosylase